MSEFQPKPGDVVAHRMVVRSASRSVAVLVYPGEELEAVGASVADLAPWVHAERIAALEALETAAEERDAAEWGALRPGGPGWAEAQQRMLAARGALRVALAASLATREENR
jgi:hypothetical protein